MPTEEGIARSAAAAWRPARAAWYVVTLACQALEVVGPERLLFGTDSSFFPRGWQRQIFEQQRNALEAIRAPADVQEKVFSGNFQRLFPLSPAGAPDRVSP